MNHGHKAKGFTLIELMLAMSFISVLLIAIAMTVIQISNIYTRGLTLKDVNQIGRSLTSELQRGVASTSAFPIDSSAVGTKYVKNTTGGRLCVGRFSYIWNYGSALSSGTITLDNQYTPSLSTNKIRFIKVPDSTGSYCTAATSNINPNGAVELLDVGDRNLAIHSFSITTEPSASDTLTGQSLYYISFILGTNDKAALSSDQTTCKAPGDMASDLNYCAVNRFDIVARAGNEVQ